MCLKEEFWHALCERMERLDLRDDARFALFADRYQHRAALVPLLAAELRRRTTGDWLERLRGFVPCGPVYSVEEALEDEHALAGDMVVGFEHPELGWLRQVGTTLKMAGATPVYRRVSASTPTRSCASSVATRPTRSPGCAATALFEARAALP